MEDSVELWNEDEINALRIKVKAGGKDFERVAKVLFEMEKDMRRREFRDKLLNEEA